MTNNNARVRRSSPGVQLNLFFLVKKEPKKHTLRVIILAFLQEKLEITGPEGPYLGLRPAFL